MFARMDFKNLHLHLIILPSFPDGLKKKFFLSVVFMSSIFREEKLLCGKGERLYRIKNCQAFKYKLTIKLLYTEIH